VKRMVVDEALQFTILGVWQLASIYQIHSINQDLVLNSRKLYKRTENTYRMRAWDVVAHLLDFLRHPKHPKINK
jgi:hypothetical protein